MRLLVDTDAFCKLSLAGLLQNTAHIFRVGLQECDRLPSLPYMLRKGSLRRMYGAEACDALIPVAEAMPVVNLPSGPWLDKLTPINAIGPGEAQIFATAAESRLIVVSGDKRALRALKDVEGYADALAGRIVVLEAVLLALCNELGIEEVRQRVNPLVASDKVVNVCFSDGNPDPREALLSYYRTLTAEVEPLILWDPRVGDAP